MRHAMRGVWALGLLGAAALGALAQPAARVSVSVVKYEALTELVKKQRGRVVVVDFWADYCVPCKREFPKLVSLHERFADQGLTAISVSLDDLAEAGTREKVQKFLEKQKATGTNLILDEKPEFWQAKLKIDGPPLVMVFNRQGELEQKFVDQQVDYAKIEKLAVELLRKK